MHKNGGVNPRPTVDQDLSVSPNINALRATDSYLYNYYMYLYKKYQLFILNLHNICAYIFIFLYILSSLHIKSLKIGIYPSITAFTSCQPMLPSLNIDNAFSYLTHSTESTSPDNLNSCFFTVTLYPNINISFFSYG